MWAVVMVSRKSHPAVDELVPQQAAHDVGGEVHDVLDLPEGLLRRLNTKTTSCPQSLCQTSTLGAELPVLQDLAEDR